MEEATMDKPVLVIMAAGMGSRYGGLKQIDPVDAEGHIIVDFSLYDAKRAGFEKAIFIIKEENEQAFREAIEALTTAKFSLTTNESEGLIDLRLKENPTKETELLLSAMILGFENMADDQDYKEYIHLTFEEV